MELSSNRQVRIGNLRFTMACRDDGADSHECACVRGTFNMNLDSEQKKRRKNRNKKIKKTQIDKKKEK